MTAMSTTISPRSGYTPVAGNLFGLKFIHEFGIINLPAGGSFQIAANGNETGLVVLYGSCEIEIDGASSTVLGSRDTVFSGLPQAAYLPPGSRCTITGGPVEIGVCTTPSDSSGAPRIIREEDVKVMQVGKDNWSREVRLIIPPGGFSQNLVMGETLNPPGNWSGTPPHRHETAREGLESVHEELYYFRVDKEQGWGVQRTYCPDRGVNELTYLRDHTVTFMPWGYHQVTAAPGYWLYYIFCVAGKGNQLTGNEDPLHNWIKIA